ncbi:DUF6959 family protein [Krasilnikovia sp. MM14-A1004]|uniref:DUF6959 family protein n=1 Tax=Krasilnikovia sp. MM14-A1004 TaxID=3373541 RepID=UPI00399D5216
MSSEKADVLARTGSHAVVHLPGRAFPGIHVPGDGFAALHLQLAAAARALRAEPGDQDALGELDHVVGEVGAVLEAYERTLAERGIRRPY